MKFLFLVVCLVYSLPVLPSAVPITQLFANVVHGQEDVLMHLVPNFKAVSIFGNRMNKYHFWLPENLYQRNVQKKAIPHDPSLVMTGFPRVRTVEFYVTSRSANGKYTFISNRMNLKNYKRVSEHQFAKDVQAFPARIKLEGYLKGENIIITENTYVYAGDMGALPADFLIRELRNTQTLDLELVKRYPTSIPLTSFVGGPGHTWFYPIVPPAEFWRHPMVFEVFPTIGPTTIHSMGELGDGLHKLEVDLYLKFENEVRRVKFTFAVTREADHIAIKRIHEISYLDPSNYLIRFYRDNYERSTTVLDQAKEFLNREVFTLVRPVDGFPLAGNRPSQEVLNGEVLERAPPVVGIPVTGHVPPQTVVGIPVTSSTSDTAQNAVFNNGETSIEERSSVSRNN